MCGRAVESKSLRQLPPGGEMPESLFPWVPVAVIGSARSMGKLIILGRGSAANRCVATQHFLLPFKLLLAVL
jgi:hypothetical protein